MVFLEASNKTAIIYKDIKITYTELLKRATYYSTLYDTKGLKKVAIFSENRLEWIYAFYSGWINNAVIIPIDFMSSTEEVEYILEDCKPEIIFCSEEQHSKISEKFKNLSYKIQPIIFEEIQTDDKDYEIKNIIREESNDIAVIMYTSGTTGSPKGVMLSYTNLFANITSVSVDVNIFREDSIILALLPFHHTLPLMGCIVAPLSVGGTIAVSPTMVSDDIIATMKNNKVNLIIGVPRFYSLIRKGIKDKINKSKISKSIFKLAEKINSKTFSKLVFKKVHDTFGGNVKHMVCGGAQIDIDVARDFRTLGFEMLEGYGMTETAPIITFTRPGRRKLGSGGESLPGCEIKIKDGEIVVRGKNVMLGYYNRPGETAEVIKEGWLHTGDKGYFNKTGHLFITGRTKEIIVFSNGKNVNPVEVEFALENLSNYISEIAVYNKNDQLHAIVYPDFIKLNKNEVHNIEEYFNGIISTYNSKVSQYKKITKINLVKTELPKTRLGKVKRFMLEEILEKDFESQRGGSEIPKSEEYKIISEFLENHTEQKVHPEDHLEIDLGLDSLDKVNFLAFLQSSFGLELSEEIFYKYSTVKNLAKYVSENKKKISSGKINWSNILKEKLEIKLPRSWFTHSLIKYASKIAFKFYFNFKNEGIENIPKEPCIIAPNHQSYFDGLFITSLLKNFQLKQTYFYAKEKHIKHRWQKFLAHRHNIIIMDINKDLKTSLQKMAAALNKGKNIIIFPEGTRTRDGKLGKFKKTFAILSKELNVPVVPVSIKGAFEALPTGKKFPKPWKKILIKFLKPIYPKEHTYESLRNLVYNNLSNYFNNNKVA